MMPGTFDGYREAAREEEHAPGHFIFWKNDKC